MAKDDKLDLIDRYLNNQLSTSELAEFNNLIRIDTSFKKRFEEYKAKILQQKELSEKPEILSIEKEPLQKVSSEKVEKIRSTKKSVGSLKKMLWISAAALAILLAFFYFMNIDSNPNTQDLFDQNFKAYPNELVHIERGDENLNSLQKTMLKYQNGDFTAALIDFENILNTNPNNEIKFYTAITHMAAGDSDQGLMIFRNLAMDKQFKYLHAVNWYKALAYLKRGDIEDAKKDLKAIVDSDQRYQRSNAEKLLATLEKK